MVEILMMATELGCRAFPLTEGEAVVRDIVIPRALTALVVAEAEILCEAAAIVDAAAEAVAA